MKVGPFIFVEHSPIVRFLLELLQFSFSFGRFLCQSQNVIKKDGIEAPEVDGREESASVLEQETASRSYRMVQKNPNNKWKDFCVFHENSRQQFLVLQIIVICMSVALVQQKKDWSCQQLTSIAGADLTSIWFYAL